MFANIYTSRTAAEAELVISLLRANEIHPLDLSMSASVFFAGADLWYHVRVPAEEIAAAQEVLRANECGQGIAVDDHSPGQNRRPLTWRDLLILLFVLGLLLGLILR
jgi:hypothetical protein